jgi:hypothetical protein
MKKRVPRSSTGGISNFTLRTLHFQSRRGWLALRQAQGTPAFGRARHFLRQAQDVPACGRTRQVLRQAQDTPAFGRHAAAIGVHGRVAGCASEWVGGGCWLAGAGVRAWRFQRRRWDRVRASFAQLQKNIVRRRLTRVEELGVASGCLGEGWEER